MLFLSGGWWNENFVYQPYLIIWHQKIAPSPQKLYKQQTYKQYTIINDGSNVYLLL